MKNTIFGIYRTVSPILFSFFKNRNKILLYHGIRRDELNSFKQQIAYIKDNFECVTAKEYVREYEKKNESDRQFCCITFDDGFSSVMDHAYPVLAKFNIKFTVFINLLLHIYTDPNSDDKLDAFCKAKFPRIHLEEDFCKGMTRQHIKTLIEDGNEIGGHTVSHPDLTRIKMEAVENELKIPIEYFKKHFQYELHSFAYPYGRTAHINKRILKAIIRAGYADVFSGISCPIPKIDGHSVHSRTSVSTKWPFNYFKSIFQGTENLRDYLQGQNKIKQ